MLHSKERFSVGETTKLLSWIDMGDPISYPPGDNPWLLMDIVAQAISETFRRQRGPVADNYVLQVYKAVACLTERQLERLITRNGEMLGLLSNGKLVLHERTEERIKQGWVDVADIFDCLRDEAVMIVIGRKSPRTSFPFFQESSV